MSNIDNIDDCIARHPRLRLALELVAADMELDAAIKSLRRAEKFSGEVRVKRLERKYAAEARREEILNAIRKEAKP